MIINKQEILQSEIQLIKRALIEFKPFCRLEEKDKNNLLYFINKELEVLK